MKAFLFNIIKNAARQGKDQQEIHNIPIIKNSLSFEQVDEAYQQLPSELLPQPKAIYKRGKASNKTLRLNVPINKEMLDKLNSLRKQRWQTKAYIVREALKLYFKKMQKKKERENVKLKHNNL